ncbi:hypothetical protein BBJ28_00007403 [Nothophytophthora sp. Chile5]|nr:hypothetical protein BBJ28_00007403 [Nothophytophthora sp. Chile5]
MYLVLLSVLNTADASSAERICGLVALGASTLLTLSCAMGVWLFPERRVGCAMVVNVVLLLLHVLVFLTLAVVTLTREHQVLGLLELSFVFEALAGCVCCRILSVKVRNDLDQKDALDITHEQLSAWKYVNMSSAPGCGTSVWPLQLEAAALALRRKALEGEQWSIFPRREAPPQTLRISQPDALFMTVNFKLLSLLPGDKLVLIDANYATIIEATAANVSLLVDVDTVITTSLLSFWNHPYLVKGDVVEVQYYPSMTTLALPIAHNKQNKLVLVVDSYSYAASTSGGSKASRDDVTAAGTSIIPVDVESTIGSTSEAKEAICYRKSAPQMYAKAQAVARLTIRKQQWESQGQISTHGREQESEWVFCTGWLLGRGNHVLTNYHCLKDAAVLESPVQRTDLKNDAVGLLGGLSPWIASHFEPRASSPSPGDTNKTGRVLEVLLNFMAETKTCRETGFMGEKAGVVEATRVAVVATNPALDYALLRVLVNDSAVDLARRYGFLKLRGSGPEDGESVYIPQHPNGEPKEIAATKDGKPAVIQVPPARILALEPCGRKKRLGRGSEAYNTQADVFYNADTEPGSSGSPVLSREDNTVVALHHAGGIEPASVSPTATEPLNVGVRADLIACDLQRRGVLPKHAVATRVS